MKRIILSLACTLFAISIMAQPGEQKNNGRKHFSPEEYKQKMEEFVTSEADLTQAEAQKFYPLLHEMLGKQRKNNHQARELMRKVNESTSENEYANIIEKSISLDIENKQLEKEYYQKFHSVLSWKKIHKVRNALYKFNIEALKKFTPPRDGEHHGDRRSMKASKEQSK